MASVYGEAYLTVAAAWGPSMHSGIFINGLTDLIASATVGLRSMDDPSVNGKMDFVHSTVARVDSTRQPLFGLGWALQGRKLSR